MNFVGSNDLSWIYQRFTPSDLKNKGIWKLELVAETQYFILHPVLPSTINPIAMSTDPKSSTYLGESLQPTLILTNVNFIKE